MSSKQFINVTALPDVPLDKIIGYLEDEDLRSFHQVSEPWRNALQNRPRDNLRRLELVSRIRENKENIRKGSVTPQEPSRLGQAQREIRERSSQTMALKKTGNCSILMECTNQYDSNTPTSVSNAASVVSMSTPSDPNTFLTPTSHFEFQDFQKAEQSLEEGQKLFRCGKCHGPVPSPVSSGPDSRDSRRFSRTKLSYAHHDPSQWESPEKRECKKARTFSDLSPIPPSPVTVASLGEKMNILVLSSPRLTTTASDHAYYPFPQPPSSPNKFNIVKRSTSCSSIDLPPHHQIGEICSPNELNLNVSGMDDSGSFYYNHHPYGFSSVDLTGHSLNCSRSCCSPRRVQRSHQHSSRFSDSGLSFEGDSIDYSNNVPPFLTNMIPSPTLTLQFGQDLNSHYHNHNINSNNSIERGRDFSNFSDGALSLSSYSHLQRSDHSLDLSSSSNNNHINFHNNNDNIDESVFADVLECPNPKCGFRFCSNCQESEHPGRPCHMLSSDQFESLFNYDQGSSSCGDIMDVNCTRDNNNSSSNKKSSSKKSNSGGKSNNKHKNQKKIPLRRLARLL